MQAGIMIRARQMPVQMIGRNGGTGFASSSSSALSLRQPNMLEGQQLPLQQYRLDQMAQTNGESDQMIIVREEDFESKSGSKNIKCDCASGDDQDPNNRPKKKRYTNRHTEHQIQEMEAFFKECCHPDDKQRKELSRELGLEPPQVRYWFQNKRTQMKKQHVRHENTQLQAKNTQLRTENEKLRAENLRYKEALSNASCLNCGGPAALGKMSFDEHHLRIENARLREKIDRISGIAGKHVCNPMVSYPMLSSPIPSRSGLGLGVSGGFGVQPDIGGEMFGADELLSSVSGQPEIENSLQLLAWKS